MIFVSTGGRRDKSAFETALEFYEQGIVGAELSGGAFSSTCERDLLSLPKDLIIQPHNYFPPPEIPFVLNLAAMDNTVAKKSIEHIKKAIRLTTLLDRTTYSFHAGFRINPQASELGKKLGRYELLDRKIAFEIFGERVASLAEDARREGVSLLVENNVINKQNLATYGEDPLLLTNPNEILDFMVSMPSNVGLLLDVAHLKVSANSLGFNLLQGHEKIKSLIKAYHLSDNDGTADSNDPVHPESWFWESLVPGLDFYTLEIYKTTIPMLVQQVNETSLRIANISARNNNAS